MVLLQLYVFELMRCGISVRGCSYHGDIFRITQFWSIEFKQGLWPLSSLPHFSFHFLWAGGGSILPLKLLLRKALAPLFCFVRGSGASPRENTQMGTWCAHPTCSWSQESPTWWVPSFSLMKTCVFLITIDSEVKTQRPSGPCHISMAQCPWRWFRTPYELQPGIHFSRFGNCVGVLFKVVIVCTAEVQNSPAPFLALLCISLLSVPCSRSHSLIWSPASPLTCVELDCIQSQVSPTLYNQTASSPSFCPHS